MALQPTLPKAQPSLWLSLTGRITRGTYLLYFFVPLLVVRLLTVAIDASSGSVGPVAIRDAIRAAFGDEALSFTPFGGPASAVGVIVLLWPAVVGIVKRLHDLNLSGWVYAGLLGASLGSMAIVLTSPQSDMAKVPLILTGIAALVLASLVFFVGGTPSGNRYGPDPLGRLNSDDPEAAAL